jgi:hypothetical protein
MFERDKDEMLMLCISIATMCTITVDDQTPHLERHAF